MVLRKTLKKIHRVTLSQSDNSHLWQTHLPATCKWGKAETFLYSEQENTTRYHYFCSTWYLFIGLCNQARERNTRDTYRKGRSQILIICRGHDSLHRRPKEFHQAKQETSQFLLLYETTMLKTALHSQAWRQEDCCGLEAVLGST